MNIIIFPSLWTWQQMSDWLDQRGINHGWWQGVGSQIHWHYVQGVTLDHKSAAPLWE